MTSLEILVASFQFLGALNEIDSYSTGRKLSAFTDCACKKINGYPKKFKDRQETRNALVRKLKHCFFVVCDN